MIWIHNEGGDLCGICEYTVLINRDVICTFRHDRRDGLAICLEKAAEAVRKQEGK